uniref:Uncharacterized protein n=1 Tax=Plectus sambesii TaxID=2011161 RepID=A0A914V3M0_9BILA
MLLQDDREDNLGLFTDRRCRHYFCLLVLVIVVVVMVVFLVWHFFGDNKTVLTGISIFATFVMMIAGFLLCDRMIGCDFFVMSPEGRVHREVERERRERQEQMEQMM